MNGNRRAYFVSFMIESPIFIGYNAASGVERTRFYIPPKNMLGAFTNAIRGSGRFSLEKVQEYFSFSTFFLSDDGREALYPRLTPDGNLLFGERGMSAWDFINQFISAKEGIKYGLPQGASEMEFILPENNVTGSRNFLVGYIFVAEGEEKNGFGSWLRCLRKLSLGEETDYGLGRISFDYLEELLEDDSRSSFFSIDGIEVSWGRQGVTLTYLKPSPLLAHAFLDNTGGKITNIYGIKERIRGHRDLLSKQSRYDSREEAYWVPGTLIYPRSGGVSFRIGDNGVWYLI